MPTPKNKYDREHLRNLALYQRQIEQIFMAAAQEAAAIGVSIRDVDVTKPFSFADYPLTKKRVAELLATLRKSIEVSIVNGVRSEWTLANNKNNELCNRVFGKNVGKLSQEQYRRYYSTNDKAREAFLERKDNGLKLSDRVWRYSNEFKSEIEMGLDLGIRSGLDAPAMARDLKQYLRHPDKLFRRVRDEHGNLHLSKAAAAFHPGRGVYRSSYMNARRLAATETNIAYRTADHERWQKMDFVVGIEIHLSNNHNCKGFKPGTFHDICDELQGRYPKDFKFTGWHPHCRCYATSILKSPEEMAEDTKRILRGERPAEGSENTVEDVPEGFTKWLQDNEERIGRASQLPYFLRDNRNLISSAKHGYTGDRFGHSMTRKEKAAIEGHQELHDYSPEQERNFRDITEATGYQRGEPMTFDDADNGRANTVGDKDNCAVCVLVHELRLRGYDITALPYNRKENAFTSLSGDTRSIWLTKKGKIPEFTSKIGGSEREIALKIERATQGIGSRYHLGWDNKMGRGHIITAVRTKEGLILYDPQKNEYFSLSEIVQEMHPESKLELLRVDRLLVNPNSLNKLTQSVV